MDITGIISALAGAAVTVISAYGAMKAKGIVLFPQAKLDSGRDKIVSLTEGNEAAQEVLAAVGNISPEELIKIFSKAGEFAQEGYTVAEAQGFGMMVVKAVGNK